MTKILTTKFATLVSGGLLACMATSILAAPFVIESPPERVALLELYTSEGCSSCPPADRWLSELKTNNELWTRVVPVAFHVDYWDYLGWPDRFAAASFSNRQREYALQGAVSTVYTPGLIYNGSEWRDWRRRS